MAILWAIDNKLRQKVCKIEEDSLWKIDQTSIQFEDSYQLLKELSNQGNLRLQSLPISKIDVEIFDGKKQFPVLYKRHYVAFLRIVKDLEFMGYYLKNSSSSMDSFSSEELKDYLLQLSFYVDEIHKSLYNQEMTFPEEEICQYFLFLRELLDCYRKYSTEKKGVKSIDCIYEEWSWNWSSQIDDEEEVEYREETHWLKDYHMESSPRDNLLEGFLENPNFDRYYRETFHDDSLFILGNFTSDYSCEEIYQKWYQYATNSFPGTIQCPPLKNNTYSMKALDGVAIVYFLIFKKDSNLEKVISLALMNKSFVVIQLYDLSLYQRYSKKYPQAIILESTDPDKLLDDMDEFMISCYNQAKEKWYKK